MAKPSCEGFVFCSSMVVLDFRKWKKLWKTWTG
nr:MAG TPA: hypothetical protein [Caudoviricetes sp.]